jgi:NADH dehydrogenase
VGQKYAVTGAFGYSGKYITQQLLDKGADVITLTNSVNRANPFGSRVKVFPYNFDSPERLRDSLKGVTVLINTYWVRFDHKDFNHEQAVRNTLALFSAAIEAGVKRVVHVSIANPSEDSKLPYYSGKAKLEKALINSGLSYAILRPAVLFGGDGILINNIAWMLRYLPVMGIFGDGKYKISPIHVEDLARLAVKEAEVAENKVMDAIGPESFEYRELIKTMANILGKKRLTVHVAAFAGLFAAWMLGLLVNDVVLTREEITGLMQGLLYVDGPAAGKIKFTEWLKENRDRVGIKYMSELARRRDRNRAYEKL